MVQVRGELPITKCRVALDAVHLAEPLTKEETASLLVDTIAHLGQELTVPGEFRSRLTELVSISGFALDVSLCSSNGES
jgi:THO complex subunit 2